MHGNGLDELVPEVVLLGLRLEGGLVYILQEDGFRISQSPILNPSP